MSCGLIGGSEGLAKDLVETALSNGKSVVTANKALLAHHGAPPWRAGRRLAGFRLPTKRRLRAVFPIGIRALRDGLVADRIERVCGILNGTCNPILTAMRESGRAFDDVLKEAQDLGYTGS